MNKKLIKLIRKEMRDDDLDNISMYGQIAELCDFALKAIEALEDAAYNCEPCISCNRMQHAQEVIALLEREE